MKRILTLALLLAVCLMLLFASGAMAAETTMTFTFTRPSNNDYTPYLVYNGQRYKLTDLHQWDNGATTCDGLSISITGHQVYVGQVDNGILGVLGTASYSFSTPASISPM